MRKFFFSVATITAVVSMSTLVSCDDNETKNSLRPSIDYSLITPETTYSQLFVDANGATTVDLSQGNARHKMFQALNYYASSSITANAHIDAPVLNNLFNNSGNPFTDISTTTISVNGAQLNASGIALSEAVASSLSASDAANVKTLLQGYFEELEEASHSVAQTASSGVSGKLANYLVDEKGIEIIQVIQKSLIGALQLDYIGNVLLNDGLNADNYSVVSGKNYTQLEHNWDEAYGFLTLNPIYLQGATSTVRNSVEFGAGAYIWEYNKTAYPEVYPAFLRGRIAIVNNDREELEEQALFIRTAFEKAIANAAIGYLEKWKTGETDAARAHAFGEGLGFIYSLRFATVHNADAAFSESILTGLVNSPNGFWDLNATKINAASAAIKAKFNL